MVLDSKIQLVRDAFGVQKLDDWSGVDPVEVLAIEGVGPATLDHIRLYLGGQGRTLKNDRTPGYWMEELGRAKVVHQMADEDKAVICPFTILIDSAEQQPFTFQGLRADADQQNRPIIVKTEWRPLGRHPDSLGDYSIDGAVGLCHIERKSVADLQGTLLSFDDRRPRFENELSNLERVKCAAVVVEGSLLAAITVTEQRGKRLERENSKLLFRSVIAMQQDYRVPWIFCDSRRLAEVTTFRFFWRFWEKRQKERKASEKMLAGI